MEVLRRAAGLGRRIGAMLESPKVVEHDLSPQQEVNLRVFGVREALKRQGMTPAEISEQLESEAPIAHAGTLIEALHGDNGHQIAEAIIAASPQRSNTG